MFRLLMLSFLTIFLLIGCTKATIEENTDTTVEKTDNTEEVEVTEETLVFVTEDFQPYVYKNAEQEGFYIDLVKEIYGRKNINIEIEYLPWGRGLEEVQNNQAFATIPWTQTADRMRSDEFSNNFYVTKSIIIYMKDNEKVQDDFNQVEDLKKYKLGTISNYFYLNELEALNFELDSSSNEREGLTKLRNGRYDVMIMNDLVFEQLVEELFPGERDKFAYMTVPFRENYHGFRLSSSYPNRAHYLEVFNEGLMEIVNDGTYESLLEDYNMSTNKIEAIMEQYKMEPIIIGLEDYAPYEFLNAEKKVSGIGLEVVRESLLRMGYSSNNIEFVVRPWSRLMEMGNRGEVDLILDAFYTDERSKKYDYSKEIYGTYDYYLISQKDKNITFDGQIFNKKIETLGIVRGYSYGDKIKTLIEDLQVVVDEVGTTDELMEGLLNNRYDVIIEVKEFSQFYLKEHQIDKELDYLWEPLDQVKSYIIYPKALNKEPLIEEIDNQIKRIKNDGTYEQIRKFYLE